MSRDCVKEVIRERAWSVGKFIKKVAVQSDVRPKLEERQVLGGGSSELLEVINSFRAPFTIPIVRMEQVGLLHLQLSIQ